MKKKNHSTGTAKRGIQAQLIGLVTFPSETAETSVHVTNVVLPLSLWIKLKPVDHCDFFCK